MATRKHTPAPIYTADFEGQSARVAFLRGEGYVTMVSDRVVAYHETYQDAYRDAAERNAPAAFVVSAAA
jgi:hypothetical protein